MFRKIKEGRSGGAAASSNNTLFVNVANIKKTDPPYILRKDDVFYNFNIKIKFITQTFRQIVYHDHEYSVDSMRNHFDMLLYQLSRLRTDERLQNDGYYNVGVDLNSTQNRYITVLDNTKTTFNNLIEVYDGYIQRVHDKFILLPTSTYAHMYYLKEFNTLLQNEEIPDEVPTNIHAMMAGMTLDELLIMLYDNIGADVSRLLQSYSSGDIDTVKDDLTYELYTNLSQKLFEIKNDDYIGYTSSRTILVAALEGLYKSAIQARAQAEEVKRLQDMINLYKNGGGDGILEGTATMMTVATIRPEVQEYITRYGFPTEGVFASEKLAIVLEYLGIDYDDYFINNENAVFVAPP
jgi:hypothetical protein